MCDIRQISSRYLSKRRVPWYELGVPNPESVPNRESVPNCESMPNCHKNVLKKMLKNDLYLKNDKNVKKC